ncbi:putative carboxylesterase, 2-hydroxyisoflavanone dehydratase [Lupinus albus]|uniref:Putative carboxylesterase, 2-hydroxyisoflavanone dehydratase n=1 Tax=Lupinus albus TaxID=3870 RepID=A0A6A4QDG6_LUPAL|nr:putative carboxylesterase, 2-hydroxyisoflavanone dehydratase [Lupinus albus]
MASLTSPTTTTKEIVVDISPYFRVFNDGTVERPLQSAIEPVPPLLHDPHSGISSKDVVISCNPTISARLYLPDSI